MSYTSPNAPAVQDVLGTWVLGTLSGAWRYAHVTAIRGDKVNAQGLGMEKVVSEDSLRRAFQGEEPEPLAQWQTQALRRGYAPALDQPWIADLAVTVKPIYGHQEGAQIGYNPPKPGRPSHACHTIFLRTLRVALDVEVHSGKEHAALHGLSNLWKVVDRLTPEQRPWLVCGDANYGNERMMAECEERAQKYLFRQRSTAKVKQLVELLERQGGWQPLAEGWEGNEGRLQLTGWTGKRRTIVLRRRREPGVGTQKALALLEEQGLEVVSQPEYEYVVLVTNLEENLLTGLSVFLSGLLNAAEQLKPEERWKRIWQRILEPFRQPAMGLLAPSG
ncbi:MAG: hypothetical protein FJ403_11315 [Verrucomicrobia bacterium]|nr:hypothetical protein [Verrucomicrobiota bacterium]